MINGFHLFRPSYAARGALVAIMEQTRKGGEAAYLDAVWLMREPVTPRSNPKQKWPIIVASDLVADAPQRLRSAAR